MHHQRLASSEEARLRRYTVQQDLTTPRDHTHRRKSPICQDRDTDRPVGAADPTAEVLQGLIRQPTGEDLRIAPVFRRAEFGNRLADHVTSRIYIAVPGAADEHGRLSLRGYPYVLLSICRNHADRVKTH